MNGLNEEGIATVEELGDMSDKDMKDCGITTGLKMKIKAKIAAYNIAKMHAHRAA